MSRIWWVEPGRLGGMPLPGMGPTLQQDAQMLAREQVTLLVSATEASTPPEAFEALGIEVFHLPVRDGAGPRIDQMRALCEVAAPRWAKHEGIIVHCFAGLGRTGTFLAAFLVFQGMEPKAAIDRVRSIQPPAIESPAQIRAISDFAAALALER